MNSISYKVKVYCMLSFESPRLGKTVLMRGHKICFCREILKIIPKLSLLPLLIWSTQTVVYEYQK